MKPVELTGMPIGALPEASFAATTVHLAPGDGLLAYTDGLTEARPDGDDILGSDGLLDRLTKQLAGMPATTGFLGGDAGGADGGDAALGSQLIKRYGEGTRMADAQRLHLDGQAELMMATDSDIEKISSAMVTLARTLQDVLGFVTGDETALPQFRELASACVPNAEQLWAHYGGDSGGW